MASGHLERRSKKGWTIVIDYGRVQVSKAIETVFPKTEQQLCVIHQIRNSTKYIPYRDLKPVMKDLKLVYGAPMLEDAEYRLEEFRDKWGDKYPHVLRSWDANWAELCTFFKYPQEVRRLIYTTNAVEGFHPLILSAELLHLWL